MVDRVVGPATLSSEAENGRELTLLRFTNILLAHRKLIVLLTIGMGLLFGLVTYLMPTRHAANSVISPENADSKNAQVSSLAAQFGVSVGGGSGGETTQFYQAMLTSQEALLRLAQTQYQIVTDTVTKAQKSGNLIQLLEIEGDTPNQKNVAVIQRLLEDVILTTDDLSNTVVIKTVAPWPELAMKMNERLLQIADEFNEERRRTRAGAERKFLEGRVQESKGILAAAENRLEDFQARNRTFASSPQLLIEQARLQRNIALQQEIYMSLAQAYEKARIDEVRNTPVLTVLSRPLVVSPVSKMLIIKILLGFIFGLMVAVMVAFARTDLDEQKRNPTEEYERFVELKQAVLDQARRVVPRGLRRRAASGA